MRNLGKFYYKDYFEGLDFSYLTSGENAPDSIVKEIKKRNAVLCTQDYKSFDSPIKKNSQVNAKFQLKIAYPGLVTGIGINHEAKIEGEFKLGVHFDYTYGMPVVYGSSVKGVLRSAFEDGNVDDDLVKSANSNWKKKERIEEDKLIPSWIGKSENFKKIIDDVFEGKGKSIYNRDIFFDAVIVRADKKGRILCSDSITPHGENPLKNPTPLTFLKIAPGCTMEFRFKLVDSEIDGEKFTADQKKALFEEIIQTVGIGAKTNVGYGQFQ